MARVPGQPAVHDPRSNVRWLPCRNVSGIAIPPHAVVRFACMNDEGYMEVDQVNGDLIAHGVNDHDEIPVDGYGFVTADFPNWARVATGGASGSGSGSASSGSASGGSAVGCGTFLGVREGSWSLHAAAGPGGSGGSSGSASSSGTASGGSSGSPSGGSSASGGEEGAPAQYQACSPVYDDPPRIFVAALGGSGGGRRIRVRFPVCISLQPDIADPSGTGSASGSESGSPTGTGGTRSGNNE